MATVRRSKAPPWVLPVALAGVLGLLAAAGAGAVLLRHWRPAPVAAVAGPSERDQGENWTHRELLDHLAGRLPPGVEVHMATERTGGRLAPPAVTYTLTPGDHDVYCEKRATAAEARDAAGATPDGFSWGRFFFRSRDRAGLDLIRQALAD